MPWATRDKIERARALRQAATPTEAELWSLLRNQGIGVRVRRQHPLAGFIVDFFIPSAGLVVEVDGPVHEAQREEDEERRLALQTLGVRVMRVTNEAVMRSPALVVEAIKDAVRDALNLPAPPRPVRGEGGGGCGPKGGPQRGALPKYQTAETEPLMMSARP